ncbi:MAG TPA: ATP-binding protein [Terriglobales bacterium]|jgi:PAS domain S-box-containing protein|nr:ATP-binding protein [Terriglobales bacterium]
MKLPLIRSLVVAPARAPILRYGVALLSTLLALIPTLFFSDLAESRLVVFAVAVMVSAWYGGWKPGLAATSFALTVSAYYSFTGEQTPSEYHRAIAHLTLFFAVALLICWFNAALRATQESLRRSESNFRSLVMNAPYGICRCNALGILQDANPAMVAMFGYGVAEELKGRHLGSLYADAQQWFQTADYFHARKEFNDLTTDCVRKDGEIIVARISGRSIPNGPEGNSFEIFMEDVTETRMLELQLRQAQKMEAIGRLAGGIAHDFNNLLMVISGYSEFLLERLGPDPRLRAPAQEISNATQRATSLTRQLLAFSRKQMLAPKVLDLNEMVAENLKMLTRMIGEDIDLVMVPGPGLGAVRADPGQIDQVIMNLAVNARDAMPQGGKLTIETANVALDESFARTHAPVTPGEYVMLAISDTGVGMDSETQSRIFEPFFTTKGAKGTGLGLSTVYGIVKQSGGFIFVDSQPQRGTAFRAYFPRVDGRDEVAVVQESTGLPRADRGQETILLVEDETNLRRLARQYLETQGYKILEAEDGGAALQIVDGYASGIDLLLTDIIMPGMNGRELAEQVTQLLPNVRVLYMSGYTENAVGHDGTLDAGINLLQKPFSLPALKDRVREVLDSEVIPLGVAMSSRTGTGVVEKKVPPFRARRFNLHLPLRYRPLGEKSWRRGTTENISRSGLLFQAQEVLLPNAQLEISLVLPSEIAGLASTEVVCRGEIVRSVEAEGQGVTPALAAKILQYHFQHGARVGEA